MPICTLMGCFFYGVLCQAQNRYLPFYELDTASTFPNTSTKTTAIRATGKTKFCSLSIISPLGLAFIPASCIQSSLRQLKLDTKGFSSTKTTEEIPLPDLKVFLPKSSSGQMVWTYDTLSDIRLSVAAVQKLAPEDQFCLLRIYKENRPIHTPEYFPLSISKIEERPLILWSYPSQKFRIPALANLLLQKKNTELQTIHISKTLHPKRSPKTHLPKEIAREQRIIQAQFEQAQNTYRTNFQQAPPSVRKAQDLLRDHETSEKQYALSQYLLHPRIDLPLIESLENMHRFYQKYQALMSRLDDEDALEPILETDRRQLLEPHLKALKETSTRTLQSFLVSLLRLQHEELQNFMIASQPVFQEEFEDYDRSIRSWVSGYLIENSDLLNAEDYRDAVAESAEDAFEMMEDDPLFQFFHQLYSHYETQLLPSRKQFIAQAQVLEREYDRDLATASPPYARSPKPNHNPRLLTVEALRTIAAPRLQSKCEVLSVKDASGASHLPQHFQSQQAFFTGTRGGALLDRRGGLTAWLMGATPNGKQSYLSTNSVHCYLETHTSATHLKDELKLFLTPPKPPTP